MRRTRHRSASSRSTATASLSHLQAPHFLAYKQEVADLVLSLTLIPLDPVRLGARW
jgi:hypothetical protein